MRLLRVVLPALLLTTGRLLADAVPELSAERLDLLDEHGYFTPDFRSAVHDLIDARTALSRARTDRTYFQRTLPALQKQAAEANSQTAALRQQLDLYAHPEDADFAALQAAMKDANATPEQRLPLVQAFVWSYPTDPHQSEAEQDLQQIQTQIDAKRRAITDAASARVAARAALVHRAKTRTLTLTEWQDFLRDMSQEDLLKLLGPPQDEEADHWIYGGSWTTDPGTGKRVGLRLNFNGTRVLSVVPVQ